MSIRKRRLSQAAGCVFLLLAANVAAQEPALSEASVALEKTVISAGEPVILDIAVQNPSATALDVDPGYDWENVEIKVVDPDGRSWTRPPAAPRQGMKFSNAVHLDAGAATTIWVVANDWFKFDEPGAYQIEVVLRGTLRSGATAHLSLRVQQKNPDALKAACSALLERVSNSQTSSESLVAAKALSDVNDSVVVPYLAAALKRREFVPQMISALARLNTDEALNALAEASKSHDPETSSQARAALSALRHPTSD